MKYEPLLWSGKNRILPASAAPALLTKLFFTLDFHIFALYYEFEDSPCKSYLGDRRTTAAASMLEISSSNKRSRTLR